jgi:hypothetical protein
MIASESKSSPIVTWIMNAIRGRGLPTDEDLRKTYFWGSRRSGTRETEMHAVEKGLSRLQRVYGKPTNGVHLSSCERRITEERVLCPRRRLPLVVGILSHGLNVQERIKEKAWSPRCLAHP